MRPVHVLALVASLSLTGCGSSSRDEGTDVPLESLGWAAEVVREPARFTALVSEGREGWIALHANDLHGAVDGFGGESVGRVRAHLALATFHDDVARLGSYGAGQLFEAWQARGSLPEGPEAPLVAALAAACGEGDAAAWAARVDDGAYAPIASRLVSGGDPFEATGDTPVAKRLAVHRAVRAGERPVADLVRAAAEPLVVVQEGDFQRQFWDPCVGATLAKRTLDDTLREVGSLGGVTALASAGLPARMFSAWPTDGDLAQMTRSDADDRERLRGLGTASELLDRLGPVEDDVDSARDWIRRLDQALDHWASHLGREADPDGRALLSDLGLIPRLRQEVIVAKAREVLRNGQPGLAGAMLEQARDPSAGLGPENGPSLFALLAEAHLRLGRTREAMDAVQPLVEAYPYLQGVRETLGDWAVLEGLDRRGDSKENP